MIKYITEFLREFDFEEEDRIDVALAYERIRASVEAAEALDEIISGYDRDTAFVTKESYEYVERMAANAGVHPFLAELVTHICLTRRLRERLLKLGFAKKNVISTLEDYKIKAYECKRMYGFIGIERWFWYVLFYELRIIGIGRLQFQMREFQIGTYKKGDRTIQKNDTVLAIHIPRGASLDQKACQRAYKEAKSVFTKLLGCENIPFFCSSWLLYHKHREFLDEKSNIVKFMNNFEILKYEDYAEGQSDLYRFLFEKKNDTPIEELPTDTSLRASYAAHMANGGKTGYGVGIFFL